MEFDEVDLNNLLELVQDKISLLRGRSLEEMIFVEASLEEFVDLEAKILKMIEGEQAETIDRCIHNQI
jgi:hypothetical protein